MVDRDDAFDVLRRPVTPARPRPQFVSALTRRLQEEIAMSQITSPTAPSQTHGALGLVHLRVADADAAMRFFEAAFGWTGERVAAGGQVSYYTLNTAVAVRLVGDPAASAVRPNYMVDDVSVAVRAIEAAGGRVAEASVAPDGGGWAFAEDRAGLPLLVYRPGRSHPHSDAPVAGDVGLLFLTEDAGEASSFYGPVLGWQLTAGHPGSTYYDTVERVGVWDESATVGADRPSTATLFLDVPVLAEAAAKIREFGGTVEELPTETDMGPYFSVRCTDGRGTAFGLMSARLHPTA